MSKQTASTKNRVRLQISNDGTEISRAMQNSSVVISAWDGEHLVSLARGLDDKETIGFIHYLLVDSDYQGLHIGDTLMKKIMEKYDKLLHVKVMPSDPHTIKFYEKYGFKQFDKYSALEKTNM
ncbi:MAG: GNAT family N-acetyltransferase [Lachnospiraceae bacterium]|nr:GNAT family N-acetyltransferase [Lachnospiraceae bacterium]